MPHGESSAGGDGVKTTAIHVSALALNSPLRGDDIVIDYLSMGSQLRLVSAQHKLRVRAIVPLTGAAADKDLMPEFPGLADSENFRDWEPGIPVDLNRIRDVDEKYWDDHRGTPKAFLGLTVGQRLWSNRYGNVTAIRDGIVRIEKS